MNKKPLRPWWLRKRLILPFILMAALPVAVALAWLRSDRSTIVIYNETGDALPPLLVQACGQTRSFAGLEDQDSVRFELHPKGPGGAIHLELAATPAWTWDGEFVEARGGYRVSIRIMPGKQVEAFTDISWWQRTFSGK
jgi:hypothetical protein